MSLLTTASKNDKKTALKLINKYADSCNNVLLENKALKAEIKDLRDNIKINKEILKRKRIQLVQLHQVSSEKDAKEWIASYQQ